MSKSIFINIFLLGSFLALLALPLGTFRLFKASGNTSSVLSATSEDFGGNLKYGNSLTPVVIKEITALAFNSKKAVYEDVFWVSNTENVAKTYKINTVKSSSVPGVFSSWLFTNLLPTITLNPGDSSGVRLEITSTNATPSISIDYLVAVEKLD